MKKAVLILVVLFVSNLSFSNTSNNEINENQSVVIEVKETSRYVLSKLLSDWSNIKGNSFKTINSKEFLLKGNEKKGVCLGNNCYSTDYQIKVLVKDNKIKLIPVSVKYHLKGVKYHSTQTVDLKNESQKIEKLIAKLTDDLKQYIEVNKSSVDNW